LRIIRIFRTCFEAKVGALSPTIALVLIFCVGIRWARLVGGNRWRIASGVTLVGVILAGIIIALWGADEFDFEPGGEA
jgi:hypothetical protein